MNVFLAYLSATALRANGVRGPISDMYLYVVYMMMIYDTDKRYVIYKELQEYVMDQALFLPSYEVTFSHLYYPYVKDLKVDLLGREYFYDVWLDK